MRGEGTLMQESGGAGLLQANGLRLKALRGQDVGGAGVALSDPGGPEG